MLRERKNDIASFVEHPAYSNFKMYTALILFFYFNFPLFTQNSSLKVIYSWNFTWSVKGAVILLRSWSTLHTEHPVCSILKIYSALILVFWFWFATICSKCMYKSHLFLKFQVLHEGSSFIASFVADPVSSSFKMYSVLILVFLF